MSFNNDHLSNLFGDDANDNQDSSNLHNDPNITPSILLEQLAYVDNFMPDLENDFTSFDSVMGTGAVNNSNISNHGGHGGVGLDERLAAELSAFADESFIFPDEEKPSHDNNDGSDDQPDGVRDNEIDSNEMSNTSNNGTNRHRNPHFLTQRRNFFLASQYDNTRQRFSSRNRNNSNTSSPADDHGGFTNFDVVDSHLHPQQTAHVNHSASPLSNLLASSNSNAQPYSISGTPSTNQNTVTQTATPYQSQQQSYLPIQMPDYSAIPTGTLLALLPKVSVPPGAYSTLQSVGFTSDQIEAIAAIIAHHQKEKLKVKGREGTNALNTSIRNEDGLANFLLEVLFNEKKNKRASNNHSDDQQFQPHQPLEHSQFSGLDVTHSHANENVNTNHDISSTTPITMDSFFHSLVDVNKQKKQEAKHSKEIKGEERHPSVKTNEPLITPHPSDSSKENTVELGAERVNSLSIPGASAHNLSRPMSTTSTHNPSINGSKNTSSSTNNKINPAQHHFKAHQKRKLKEQELENSVQELNELAMGLQQRIHTLEMENRLLKNLVMEKSDANDIEEVESVRRQLIRKIGDEASAEGNSSDRNSDYSVEETKF